MHCESPIKRRISRKIWVGSVPVGGDAPIAVQSMTNSDTNDVAATVAQIRRLEDAGADIVRVSVPDMDAAEAFGRIKQQVKVPLVADIHFDYQIALRVAELGVAVEELTRNQCHPRAIGELSDTLQNVCGAVYAQSLQSAMVIMALLYIASSVFFLLTWRRLDKDMVDRN